jgi:putative membrane protein
MVHSYRIRNVGVAQGAFLLLGVGTFFWVLHDNDYRSVLHIVTRVGGGLALIVILRGVILAIGGLAWWRLLRSVSAASVPVVIGFRMIGEAINVMLPVAAIGGDVVRAMLLQSRGGVDGGAAAASTLVDVLLQAAAQALFMLIGVVLSLLFVGAAKLSLWAAAGVGVAALALGGFYAVQRFGGARLLERRFAVFARRWQVAAGSAMRLDEPLQSIYADRRAVGAALSLHELAWLINALETWVALWLMGMPVSPSTALVLESLSRGLRSAAFVVPGGLGVQEGGYIAFGAALGIPSETALALSLIKRAPDLVIGFPGLLAWYLLPIQRLLPVRSVAQAPASQGRA